MMKLALGRVRDLLLRPTRTWTEIADEPGQPLSLLKTYVAPLAAIPAICGLIGGLTIGESLMGVTYRPHILAALGEALIGFVLTLAGVWAMAATANMLAPMFGGVRDFWRAFKLAAYAGTAGWVLGVFELVPALGWPAMLLGALWSLILLYTGLAKLMRAAPDKAVSYFATLLLAALLFAVIFGVLTSMVRDHGGPLSVA